MSDDPRDVQTTYNPPCPCGHMMLRHVFGNGWCVVPGCTCTEYDGPRPAAAPAAQVDTVVSHAEGLASVGYVPK